jgi:hypothetical protein
MRDANARELAAARCCVAVSLHLVAPAIITLIAAAGAILPVTPFVTNARATSRIVSRNASSSPVTCPRKMRERSAGAFALNYLNSIHSLRVERVVL